MEGAIVENGHGNTVIANVHVNNSSDHNINDKWVPAPKETFSPHDMNSLPRANKTGDLKKMEQVTASPSRVVDSVGSFDERKAFWVEKDMEEKKKRESVASSVSIEDYHEGFENTAFMGVEKIDSTPGGTVKSMSSVPGDPRTSSSDTVKEEKLVPLRTPSPYEIERTKEAIFLDTDDVDDDDVDQDTRVEVETQIKKQILQAHLSEPEGLEESSPERKVIDTKQQSTKQVFEEEVSFREERKEGGQHGMSSTTFTTTETRVKTTTLEKSEFETSEKQHVDSSRFHPIDPRVPGQQPQQRRHSPEYDEEDEEQVVRQAASSLVSEIEERVEEKMRTTTATSSSSSSFARGDSAGDSGRQPTTTSTTTTSKTNMTQISTKISDSSVDITDEELLSTGDASSPEPLKHQPSGSGERRGDVTLGTAGDSSAGCGAGTPEAHTVRSSSSGEFYTAREDGGLRSSSDDPTRPKSWDSSLLGQVSTNASGSCGSEYQTALSAASAASSSESYLGSLSSDASASETLVASQISLGRSLLQDDDEDTSDRAADGRRRGSRESRESYPYQQEEDDVPPPLPPRLTTTTAAPTSTSSTTTTTAGDSVGTGSRSVHCEARHVDVDRNATGLPVTLTSSTSGTTVCTQVETTYEARVRGDPELADDQEGNIMVLESSNSSTLSSSQVRPVVRTHRRAESQSWNESLLYGIEEKIEDEQLKDIIFPSEDIDEINDLFLSQCDDLDDPIERPVTPEPGYSPHGEDKRKRIVYYPGSSFDQSKDSLDEGDDPSILPPTSLSTDFTVDPSSCGVYERSLAMPRLEDIEEEGSLKNSPKSVLSLEMGSLDERNGVYNIVNGNGNGNGEKPTRPASRESSSSLNEFERLESAVEEEESERDGKKDEPVLSEIEEGHESQVSEESDETEMCGEPDPYDADEDNDDKMMKIFSEKFEEMVEDGESPEMTEIPEYATEEQGEGSGVDPMTYFSTTIEPRSPEALTNTDTSTASQWDEPTLCKSSELIGTTSADSSLEFRLPDRVTTGGAATTTTSTVISSTVGGGPYSSPSNLSKKMTRDLNLELSTSKMTSSGDSLENSEPKNLMEVSKDSLEFDDEENNMERDQLCQASSSANSNNTANLHLQNDQMIDSLTRSTMVTSSGEPIESGIMTDSLELASGQALTTSQSHAMGESVDSLTGKSSDEKSGSGGELTGGAVGGGMVTSTDSLEGPPGPPSSSSATSMTADAAMWSSGTGSAATLVSSQEDLTLENQF